MGLKFKVTAKDGKTYSAEKVQPLRRFKDAEEEKKEEKKEELVLSEKEIKLLKELAEKSGDLLALLEKKGLDEEKKDEPKDKKDSKDEEEFEFEEEEEEVSANDEEVVDFPGDDEEEEEDHSEEGLVEVDEDLAEVVKDGCATHDSKSAFGAIEKRRPVEDSVADEQEDIFNAWANRYNKKGDNK